MKLLLTTLALLMLACSSKYAYVSGKINSQLADEVVADIERGAKTVFINSPGGLMEPARRIRDAIQDSKEHIVCIVESNAGSAAFWILQGCDYRVAMSKATLMIHNPRMVAMEDPKGLDIFVGPPTLEEAIDFEVARLELVLTIAPRLRMLPQDYEAKVNLGDWEMTAEEAFRAYALDLVVK